MILASLNTGDPQGRLLVVASDLSVAVDAGYIAPSMQCALENWPKVAPRLKALSRAIDACRHPSVFPFDPAACMPPVTHDGDFAVVAPDHFGAALPFYEFW